MTTNQTIESSVMPNSVGTQPLLGRRLNWLVLNAAQCWLTYAWLFESREWAGNILKFWLGWVTFVGLLCFTKGMQKICRKKGRSVPVWMAQAVDVAVVMALAAQGHFVMAGLFLFAVIAESVAFDDTNAASKTPA